MHSAYIPLAAAARGTSVPVVASEHIVYDHYRGKLADLLMLRWVAHSLVAATAVSTSMVHAFPAVLRGKMTVIPNPVTRPPRRAPVRKRNAPLTVLAVGRLEGQKDHETLIHAFGRIADRFPQWRLRIVGEGSLRQALQAQVEQSGLGSAVELAGSNAAIADEYAEADIFAMPSKYESFGLACAEALAAGVPAIGFLDCPGTNEVIKPNLNGILVSGSDRVTALADGLAELMSSRPLRLRLGAAGPASVAEYDLAAVASQWEKLLRQATARDGLQ
jgi:glycosyltransferase involved in cell wall biosynthesis